MNHYFAICLSCWLLGVTLACQPGRPLVSASPTSREKDVDLFRRYIVGTFDNAEQVKAEARARTANAGHPLARRVNRVADDRVRNRPDSLRGFFLLEETYHTYPGVEMQLRPALFFVDETATGAVRLHSLSLPASLDKKLIRHDNRTLVFDYTDLSQPSRFPPMIYALTDRGFQASVTAEWPDSVSVTRQETVGPDFLDVMELTTKARARLTPYENAIQYKKVKE